MSVKIRHLHLNRLRAGTLETTIFYQLQISPKKRQIHDTVQHKSLRLVSALMPFWAMQSLPYPFPGVTSEFNGLFSSTRFIRFFFATRFEHKESKCYTCRILVGKGKISLIYVYPMNAFCRMSRIICH